ncbi:MAG: polysaccharide biosynthesis protein PslH [Blastocatellia bacterium]|jgi:sugar transferase (PEP-CTERM/EpsH1 system associated)|nr:polysaccharide biosynthesis protein PslH [Blastocatellia bacterium]
MRVLQFAPRVCWPLDTGAKLRNYHLARVLAQRARVSLLAFTDQQHSSDNLAALYEQVIAIPRDSAYTPAKVLRGVLGKTPLPVLNYTTNAMKQKLERLVSENDFDIVQVESIHLMSYLPIIRKARRQPLVVCDWHNIESELMQRYSEREAGLLRRAYASRTAGLMSEFEKRALREFDAHVTVSQRDAEQLRYLSPEARIFVIENGVDTAFYSDQESGVTSESPAHRIVFVGSMDYHANIDGAVNFAREVWPRVRERHPELTFTIVGKDPASEVRELGQLPGVEVTGTVEDVRPFYRAAIAAVVPLNVGGGSRLKILEAMAAGVPVVSTTLGAEGLKVQHDENILIADTNEQLAEAIISLVENETRSHELSSAGRALVASRYDWSSLGDELFRTYEELLS